MEIKYLGHASFFIKTKDAKIVTDPFDPYIGFKYPKVEADIVTVSHNHKDHNRHDLIAMNPLVLDMPGEFEKKGVRIFGFKSYHDKTQGTERGEVVMYKIESENMSILHCGDIGYVPEDSFIDAIGDVDILMIPVGGYFTIDSQEAMQLVKKIEPSIVIPMHYNHEKLSQEHFGQLTPVSDFLKKLGIEGMQPIPKLIVRKEELEQEMKIVTMEISQ